MTHYNLEPAVSKIEYSVNGITTSDVIKISNTDKSVKVLFSFSGLKYLKDGNDLQEMTLLFSFYTRRGTEDVIVHGIQQKILTEEMMLKDNCIVEFDLLTLNDKFKFEDEQNYFKYDISFNAMFIKLAYASPVDAAGLDDDARFRYLYEVGNELLHLKVPMVMDDGK